LVWVGFLDELVPAKGGCVHGTAVLDEHGLALFRRRSSSTLVVVIVVSVIIIVVVDPFHGSLPLEIRTGMQLYGLQTLGSLQRKSKGFLWGSGSSSTCFCWGLRFVFAIEIQGFYTPHVAWKAGS